MGLRSLFKIKKKKKKSSSITLLSRSRSTNLKNELMLVFEKFDANGDGKISSSELGSILANLGQPATPTELNHMIREVDKDGDGFIDIAEFIALNTRDDVDLNPEAVLRDAFSTFDVENNGSISAEEIMRVLTSLGDDCTLSECSKMIKNFDHDGDGMIDFDEFKTMMDQELSLEVA